MWPKVINKVKVTHQGQGHIKVKVKYLLPFQLYVKFYLFKHINPLYVAIAGADPGLSIGGGANPPGGAPTYDFAKFHKKLHEVEKILGCKGGHAPGAPP